MALDDMGGSGQARMMSEALVAQAVDRQVPGDPPLGDSRLHSHASNELVSVGEKIPSTGR